MFSDRKQPPRALSAPLDAKQATVSSHARFRSGLPGVSAARQEVRHFFTQTHAGECFRCLAFVEDFPFYAGGSDAVKFVHRRKFLVVVM